MVLVLIGRCNSRHFLFLFSDNLELRKCFVGLCGVRK